MYFYGWDVKRDPTEAEKWFQKALRKGHIRLLADLGDYTRDGWLGHAGIKTRALAWYLAATHFGIIRAPAAVLAMSFDMPASKTRAAEALSKKLIAGLKMFDVEIYPFP
jgi:TPR repeat protein